MRASPRAREGELDSLPADGRTRGEPGRLRRSLQDGAAQAREARPLASRGRGRDAAEGLGEVIMTPEEDRVLFDVTEMEAARREERIACLREIAAELLPEGGRMNEA